MAKHGKGTKRVLIEWDDATNKALIGIYNTKHKGDFLSLREVTYRLNKKFGTKRGSHAVGQQIVKLRKNKVAGYPKLRPVAKDKKAGYVSEAAIDFQGKIEGATKKASGEDTPRRNGKVREQNGRGKDQLLKGMEPRVMHVDLQDKGYVKVEVGGPILLNDEFVNSLSAAATRALTI